MTDEEEFKTQLKAKADAVKADIKAGRYRNGEIHENISQTNPILPATREEREVKTDPYQEIIDRLMLGILSEHKEFKMAPILFGKPMPYDEYVHGPTPTGRFTEKRPADFYDNPSLRADYDFTSHMIYMDEHSSFEPKPEPDWKRKTFFSGPSTPPSETKRKKLRAKRKKHK